MMANILIKFFFFQNQFLKRLLILFIHLFFLSLSVYLRQATENIATKAQKDEMAQAAAAAAALLESNGDEGAIASEENDGDDDNKMQFDAQNIIRYCSEVATLIGVLSYVIFQQGDEIKNQGLAAFMKQLVKCSKCAIYINLLTNSFFFLRQMLLQKRYFCYPIYCFLLVFHSEFWAIPIQKKPFWFLQYLLVGFYLCFLLELFV